MTLVDSTPAVTTFGQTVVPPEATPKEALTTRQKALDAGIES